MQESTIRSGMPFNLDDLIHRRSIEGNRVEFKATWDDRIKPAVVRTVCAFANDLLNLNGGYIVLGVEEEGGRPILPPRGLDDLDLEEVQKKVYEACFRISPPYQPILFPGDYQGRAILVIWAPGGDTRPYQAPESLEAKGAKLHWYVRQGPQSIAAKDEPLRQLMELAAKTPFDDRRSLQSRIEDISPTLVRRFLHQVRSDILNAVPPVSDYDLYRKLRIVAPINAHEVPRNVGLLFFHEDPDQFFPGARIEVVRFQDDAGGDLMEERVFRGPLPDQIRATLEYLRNVGGDLVRKVADQAEAVRSSAYPFEAIEEAVVNAVYHRGYDGPPEPVKVYIYPDRMEIISYPGPVPGVKREQLQPGQPGPAAPARNRRIGEFLKELGLAEARGTGLPKIQRKMRENDSPEAKFDFDDDRTYYRTTLPINHFFLAIDILKNTTTEIKSYIDSKDFVKFKKNVLSLKDGNPTRKGIVHAVLRFIQGIDAIEETGVEGTRLRPFEGDRDALSRLIQELEENPGQDPA
jgi:ATP-dependent DNA helicase RecG